MDADGALELPEGVFVDGATALELVSALRIAAKDARQNGSCLTPRLIAAWKRFEVVGERWAVTARAEYRTRSTSVPPDTPSVTVPGMPTIGSKEASIMLGISDRAVRALASRRTLRGRKAGDVWVFDLADVIARKEATHAA